MAPVLQSFLLVAVASLVRATRSNSNSVIPPSTGNDWMSLAQGIEFQPATAKEGSTEHQQRALRHAQKRFLTDESQQQQSQQQQLSYVDSMETYYSAHAQAWRYVGFYTDCGPVQDDHHRRRNRKLNEDEEEPCVRYLLWAAVSATHRRHGRLCFVEANEMMLILVFPSFL
jgi:hypothetical protein